MQERLHATDHGCCHPRKARDRDCWQPNEAKADELQQEVTRKAMEIQYLETDQEESQDQITRYVKIFGLKSFVGAMCTLAVIYGLF